jgi:hypothetical protein
MRLGGEDDAAQGPYRRATSFAWASPQRPPRAGIGRCSCAGALSAAILARRRPHDRAGLCSWSSCAGDDLDVSGGGCLTIITGPGVYTVPRGPACAARPSAHAQDKAAVKLAAPSLLIRVRPLTYRRSGAKGIRTPDPLPAEQVLYQLSYSPENARTVYPKRHPGPNLIRPPPGGSPTAFPGHALRGSHDAASLGALPGTWT